MLDGSDTEPEEPIVEEQEVQEEQPDLDLSGLLDVSDAEHEEPIVKEQEVQETNEESSHSYETNTTEQDNVDVDKKLEENKQAEKESPETSDDKRQGVLQKDIKQHYEPKIDFSDIDPMFGEAPTFDAEAIQRAYNESKNNKELIKDKKPKKLFGKQRRS